MPEIFVEKFTYIIGTRQNASIKFDTNHNGVITFKYQQEISYALYNSFEIHIRILQFSMKLCIMITRVQLYINVKKKKKNKRILDRGASFYKYI